MILPNRSCSGSSVCSRPVSISLSQVVELNSFISNERLLYTSRHIPHEIVVRRSLFVGSKSIQHYWNAGLNIPNTFLVLSVVSISESSCCLVVMVLVRKLDIPKHVIFGDDHMMEIL
jgi:hypothetical protein